MKFDFRNGGNFVIDYTNAWGKSPTFSAAAAIDFITVGDDKGDTVTVTLQNYSSLLRHNSLGHSIVVNSEGVLELDGVDSFNSTISANIVINGGTVNASSFVDTVYGSGIGTSITFNERDSSFTAAYGGQFADLAAVQADVNSVFVSGVPSGSFEYTDNGSSFTLTYIPEPTSASLLGLGGLMLIARRKR